MIFEIFAALLLLAVIFSIITIRDTWSKLYFSIITAGIWFVLALSAYDIQFNTVVVLQNESINTTYNLTVLTSTPSLFSYRYYDPYLGWIFAVFGVVYVIIWFDGILSVWSDLGGRKR